MPMIVYTKTMFVGIRRPEDVWLLALKTYSSKRSTAMSAVAVVRS